MSLNTEDAYTTEDIIYKWKYKEVEVEATQMAQFDFCRASLSTSVNIFKIGKSYFSKWKARWPNG